MLEKIIDITVSAGEIIMKLREDGFQTKTKSDSFDFVTSADIKSEEYILNILSEEFPEDSILSEEKGKIENDASRVWMVDPLDGTKNFKNGGTGFSIMIGLYQDGKPVLGVVHAPAKDLTYFAQRGYGSYVRMTGNDHLLHVSKTKYLKDSIMVTRISYGEKRDEDRLEQFFDVKERIPESSVGIKLGLIASGNADFHVNTQFKASKWDTCASQIILEEAGGRITDLCGHSLDYNQSENKWLSSFVASNGILHKYILDELQRIYPSRE